MPPAAREAPLALALAGPTASGKTAMALAFAARSPRPVEIISVDSALVYRGMDIGTAKPDAAQRAAVPHHLIDILDPRESYSAARFTQDATRLVHDIRARGHVPLLVGGTMLYFKALQDGLDAMPPADAAVRAAIDARAAAVGWPALHAELAQVDPPTAARLAPADAQRIQRALEVHAVSGKPLSQWQGGAAADRGMRLAMVSLEPSDRQWLHQRIAQRFDAMLDAGLLQEVTELLRRSDLHADLPSMRCVGYRQAWAALQAGLHPAQQAGLGQSLKVESQAKARATATANAEPQTQAQAQAQAQAEMLSRLREQGIAATRQLAKRQLTWLRSFRNRRPVACDRENALTACMASLTAAQATLTDELPFGETP